MTTPTIEINMDAKWRNSREHDHARQWATGVAMNKVKVEKVTTKPNIPFLQPAYGITSEASARTWGEKVGCSIVYWQKLKMRAYGVKAKKVV